MAAGYVQALKPGAVGGDGVDRGLGDVVTRGGVPCRRGQRDVEGIQVAVVGDERDEPGIRQVAAPGQGQALDPGAFGEGHDASIVDLSGEGGEVETADEVAVGKVGLLQTEGLADGLMLVPCRARGAVPENVDGVARPPLAGQHGVQEIRRAAELGKDGDLDLVGQALDGREALVVGDLHVLDVWHAERGLRVVGAQEEVGLFVVVVGRDGRAGGRGRSRVLLQAAGRRLGLGLHLRLGLGLGLGIAEPRCDDIEGRALSHGWFCRDSSAAQHADCCGRVWGGGWGTVRGDDRYLTQGVVAGGMWIVEWAGCWRDRGLSTVIEATSRGQADCQRGASGPKIAWALAVVGWTGNDSKAQAKV